MDDLRERRERQKEMVEAIVKQRDMYRTLLAQATPLPQESPQVRKTTWYQLLLLVQCEVGQTDGYLPFSGSEVARYSHGDRLSGDSLCC